LKVLSKEDVRAAAGQQPFVKTVPLNLVYVADFAKAKGFGGQGETMPTAEVWSFAATGAMAENVYLFCASEGLAAVLRAMIDRDALGKVLKLRPEQHIILSQSVGHFKQ
jgi:nitroreductase